MNGFYIMADSYKSLVKRGEMTEEQAKRSIEQIFLIFSSVGNKKRNWFRFLKGGLI